MNYIYRLLENRIVILDGATGTELQKRGMPRGACPEQWCLENPKIIRAVHAAYKKAGANVIYTSTFGANRVKFADYGIRDVRAINKELARLARRAVGKGTLIAGDIGPTGKFVEPFGDLSFDEAVDIFKEQARGLLDGGVDLFAIETMIDIQEARAALVAVKELARTFTMVTMTFEKDGRTLNGTDPLTALITLQSLGADAFGANCSTGPSGMLEIIKGLKPYAKVPLIAKPNAGLPQLVDGETVFTMSAKEFGSFGKAFIKEGVNLLGGCCGTTPGHIRELAWKIRNAKTRPP
ncbi:MAG: homocysteine S-methyltransferase family protein, partial [Candidatus Omnitrophica bacterium]|nr:homocysteine S-methyltransferase family protein [Candidatus Omnitrophota bacterium]